MVIVTSIQHIINPQKQMSNPSTIATDVIPPIFKWAESLSSNLDKLQQDIKHNEQKLEQFHAQCGIQKEHTSQSTPKSTQNTFLSPIKSPLSTQSKMNITQQTIISFKPNATCSENTENAPKMFKDIPESLHTTASKVTTDGEQIIAEVAKKIWGKNVPETFLTALDIEIPISDDEHDSHEPYPSVHSTHSSQSSSRALTAKRRSIILPALEVTKENIPNELLSHHLGFPNKANPDVIIPKIIETTEFETNAQKDAFTRCAVSHHSLNIISDAFWWFLINEWKLSENASENVQSTQNVVFHRMAKNYVNQSVFTCFVEQYPKSKDLFTNDVKLKILRITSKWTLGCVPRSLSIDHWLQSNATTVSRDNHVSEYAIMPTKVIKRDVVFKHSEFVRYYLKYEAKIEVGEKTTVKVNMTYTKPANDMLFHKLNEDATHKAEETENARHKLMSLQKELNKMIRNDKNALKDYERDVQQQLSIARKNKKEFVKSVIKQLVPRDLVEGDQVYI
eukprot:711751_1